MHGAEWVGLLRYVPLCGIHSCGAVWRLAGQYRPALGPLVSLRRLLPRVSIRDDDGDHAPD